MGSSPLLCFGKQNSEFCTRITNLCESHTSPVILCLQNSVISIRIASLYGSQPLSMVFALKHRLFELNTSLYSSQTSPVVLCMQISDFRTRTTSFCESKLFLHAKQRLLDQNNKSLCFPDLICHFVHVQKRA